MTSPDKNSLTSELQFRVMRLLEANPQMNQRELSRSLGGINYYLNALAGKGSIKIKNFRNNKNKWVYAYLLTQQGLVEKTALTSSFLKRKMQEYQLLKVEIEALSKEVKRAKIKSDYDINLLMEAPEKKQLSEAGIRHWLA